MSELKVIYAYTSDEIEVLCSCAEGNEFYLKSEADKVIAELKDKIQQKDFFWAGCGFEKRGFKNAIAVAEYVERLEKELAEHCKDAAANPIAGGDNDRI